MLFKLILAIEESLQDVLLNCMLWTLITTTLIMGILICFLICLHKRKEK
jgi:hypothetical protein